jgi:hypothetical protein
VWHLKRMGLDWLISRNAGGSTRMSNDVYVRFFVFAVLRFFTWGGASVRHLPRSTPHVNHGQCRPPSTPCEIFTPHSNFYLFPKVTAQSVGNQSVESNLSHTSFVCGNIRDGGPSFISQLIKHGFAKSQYPLFRRRG